MNTSIQYSDHCVLKRWERFPPLSEWTRISLLVVMSLTLVVGAIGNSLVLVLFSKYRSLRTTSNMFVINLSVADLLLCLLCLPLLIKNCLTGPFQNEMECAICNIDAFLGSCVAFVSILSLAALAVDRCCAINRTTPSMVNDNKTTLYIGTAVIWLIALIGAVMPMFGFGRYVLDGSQIFCTFDFFTTSAENIAYNITIQIVYFYLPLTLIVTCYSIIFTRVRSHEYTYFRRKDSGEYAVDALRRTRRNNKCERNELKTLKASVILITVFCASWTPYSIVSLVSLYGDGSEITPLTVMIPAIFAKLSTVLNPVFYALIHERFKRKLRQLFRGYSGNLSSNVTINSSRSRRASRFHVHSGFTSMVLSNGRQAA